MANNQETAQDRAWRRYQAACTERELARIAREAENRVLGPKAFRP